MPPTRFHGVILAHMRMFYFISLGIQIPMRLTRDVKTSLEAWDNTTVHSRQNTGRVSMTTDTTVNCIPAGASSSQQVQWEVFSESSLTSVCHTLLCIQVPEFELSAFLQQSLSLDKTATHILQHL